MAKGIFEQRYSFPIEIADGVRLDTVRIEFADEDKNQELIGILTKNLPKSRSEPDMSQIPESLGPAKAAEQHLALLVGSDGVNALREILMAYATKKGSSQRSRAASRSGKRLHRLGSEVVNIQFRHGRSFVFCVRLAFLRKIRSAVVQRVCTRS